LLWDEDPHYSAGNDLWTLKARTKDNPWWVGGRPQRNASKFPQLFIDVSVPIRFPVPAENADEGAYMAELIAFDRDDDERRHDASQPTPVTDELNRILALLRHACPPNARISFDFDERLHVHVDVRNLEEVAAVEAALPTLGQGLFSCLRRGATPNRRFLHRVSALVTS
jgi:hypothetical protein